MKVKELVEKLQALDQNQEVTVWSEEMQGYIDANIGTATISDQTSPEGDVCMVDCHPSMGDIPQRDVIVISAG